MNVYLKIGFIIFGLAYLISPVDIIPDLLLPYIGWIDDGLVIGTIVYLIRYGKLPNFFFKKPSHFQQPFEHKPSDFASNKQDPQTNRSRDHKKPSSQQMHRTPYDILGIGPLASKKEIQTAYREAIKKYHPDKLSHLGEEFSDLANKKFLEIQNAYHTLIKNRGYAMKNPATMTDVLTIGSKKIEIQWHRKEKKNLPVLIFYMKALGAQKCGKISQKKYPGKQAVLLWFFPGWDMVIQIPALFPWKINFMHKQALHILPDIIRTAHIKDYILIGHSDGGSIALIFAGSPHARGLKGVITQSAHVFCEQITIDCIRQAKINYEQHHLKQGLEKYHGKNTENAFRGWNDVWLNPNFINWNIEKYLSRIRVPMLAIQGKDDQYGTIKQIQSIKRHASCVETCLIDDCRHSPHLEQPEQVLNIMTQFIQQILA